MKDDHLHLEGDGQCIVTHIDGVKVTVCENRFEVLTSPLCDVREQQTMQSLREWIRKRQAKLREPGDLSG